MDKIGQVISALQSIDIPARRLFFGSRQPELLGPAATVGIHSVSPEETVLQILVLSPPKFGGWVCENAALAAAEAVGGLGAQCRQGTCRYDGEQGLFSVEILATWVAVVQAQAQTLPYTVAVNGEILTCVTGVTAKHTSTLSPVGQLGAGNIVMRWEKREWEIQVEEMLPPGAPITEANVGTFTLEIRRANGTERYPKCRWLQLQRRDTAQGVQQLRVAHSFEEREIVNGTDEI